MKLNIKKHYLIVKKTSLKQWAYKLYIWLFKIVFNRLLIVISPSLVHWNEEKIKNRIQLNIQKIIIT